MLKAISHPSGDRLAQGILAALLALKIAAPGVDARQVSAPVSRENASPHTRPAEDCSVTSTPLPGVDPSPLPSPTPLPAAAPNDTYWSSRWAPDAIGARSAWALTRGGPEIVVAVLDTDVDFTHPDRAGRLVGGTNIGAGDRVPTDENGHGTHVAGIIAAATNNARGIAGTAPGVLVMPVKIQGHCAS